MDVRLITKSNIPADDLISYSAKGCYEAGEPKMGAHMNIEKGLFEPGHHTTLQHGYYTFRISDIAISDVTFGLHLASPFYNSSQRSGRFCGEMFGKPDYNAIKDYIKKYWPEVGDTNLKLALEFVFNGISIYQEGLDNAVKIAEEFIREERPKATGKYILQNAPKFAQEQLRMFISTIFPTALTFSLDLSAITAMYRSAWTPVMRDVTEKMARIVLMYSPEFSYMFNRMYDESYDWSPRWLTDDFFRTYTKPRATLLSVSSVEDVIIPPIFATHPVDALHFSPEFMNNFKVEIKTLVEMSVATMGQDQRHRTISRTPPEFTGAFYIPPVVDELNRRVKNDFYVRSAKDMIAMWNSFFDILPKTLATALAPYGAMVRYQKSASLNAAIHELAKRSCWCAQEEIFHLALILRKETIKMFGDSSNILDIFPPPCVKTGKCTEGRRYCGIIIKGKDTECFIDRKV